MLLVGLLVGALSAHLQGGTLDALGNSISTWLVAPFLVGLRAGRPAVAGVLTCLAQLAGYYAATPNATSLGLVAFWVAAALVGGPVFGVAGHHRAFAVLGGLFVAEGLYAYVLHQHAYLTGGLWIAIGLTIGHRQLQPLALTVPLGLAGEAVLTAVLGYL